MASNSPRALGTAGHDARTPSPKGRYKAHHAHSLPPQGRFHQFGCTRTGQGVAQAHGAFTVYKPPASSSPRLMLSSSIGGCSSYLNCGFARPFWCGGSIIGALPSSARFPVRRHDQRDVATWHLRHQLRGRRNGAAAPRKASKRAPHSCCHRTRQSRGWRLRASCRFHLAIPPRGNKASKNTPKDRPQLLCRAVSAKGEVECERESRYKRCTGQCVLCRGSAGG